MDMDMNSRHRRAGRACRCRTGPSEVMSSGVWTEVWQVVGRGMAMFEREKCRGAETTSDAGQCVDNQTTEESAMFSGNQRLNNSSGVECNCDELRGEHRTIRDDESEATSDRLSGTIFDDMTAAPVLSALLSARVERGGGGQRGGKSSSGVCPRRTTARRSIAKKLSEAFTIGVCFLSIVRLPAWTSAVPLSRSAPSARMSEDRFSTKPKWINACGASPEGTDGRVDGRHSPVYDPDGEVSHLSDQNLISTILIVAKRALMNSERWKNDYVNRTFNIGFQEHHTSWKTHRYNWLPSADEIPKELNETAPDGHLEMFTLIDALKHTFTIMQKYACGLEQVTWDLEDQNSPFKKNFTEAEFELRDIICEIEVALIEKGEKRPEDIQRDLMPEDIRKVDQVTDMNLRDWLIFRDYMNAVEYVIQVFEFLQSKMGMKA